MSKKEDTVQQHTPYRGFYQRELDTPDEDENTENAATQTENPDDKLANSQEGPRPEVEAWKTRYDSLKGHHDKTISELRKELANLKTQIAQTSKQKGLPSSQEELEEWRKQYPEVFNHIKTIARFELEDKQKELDSRFEQLELATKQTRRDKAEATLLRLHPDFLELRADANFHNWVKEQPQQIQAWLYDNEDDPLLAAKALDLYKMETGKTTPAKKQKSKEDAKAASLATTKTERQSSDVTADGKKVWKTSEIKKMKPHQFTDEIERELDRAIIEGRIVDDLN